MPERPPRTQIKLDLWCQTQQLQVSIQQYVVRLRRMWTRPQTLSRGSVQPWELDTAPPSLRSREAMPIPSSHLPSASSALCLHLRPSAESTGREVSDRPGEVWGRGYSRICQCCVVLGKLLMSLCFCFLMCQLRKMLPISCFIWALRKQTHRSPLAWGPAQRKQLMPGCC